MIYCKLSEEQMVGAAIHGKGDEVLVEMIAIMVSLRKSEAGTELLANAYEISKDPEVVKHFDETFRTFEITHGQEPKEFKA